MEPVVKVYLNLKVYIWAVYLVDLRTLKDAVVFLCRFVQLPLCLGREVRFSLVLKFLIEFGLTY